MEPSKKKEGIAMLPEKTTLHITDVVELDDLAQEGVLVVTSGDCRLNEDGSLSETPLWNREQAMRELRRLRGKGTNAFFIIRDGKWQRRTVADFLYYESMQSLRDFYLHPQKEYICRVLRSLALSDGFVLGDDVTDDVLLSMFSVEWYHYLERFDEQSKWNAHHGLPASVPGVDDTWYVDLGDRIEIGTLDYVASEYAHSGLFFPYKDGDSDDAHVHSFESLLQEVLRAPQSFSLKGYESSYSEQEREFLLSFQKKLLEDACGHPKRVLSDDSANGNQT